MENKTFVDQLRTAAEQFMICNRALLCRQGVIVSNWRRRGERRFGPYFRVAVRDDAGRQRSVYLGPDSALVTEIRNLLAMWQAPLREQRRLAKCRKRLLRAYGESKLDFDSELEKIGLYRKGTEIRGWSQLRPAKVKVPTEVPTSRQMIPRAVTTQGSTQSASEQVR